MNEWHLTIYPDGLLVYDLLPLNDPQWHVLRRPGGSVSVYWTTKDFMGHVVVWDSLDGTPMGEVTRSITPVYQMACMLLGRDI